jgi:hypothetical protein
MRQPALELGEVTPYRVHNLQQPRSSSRHDQHHQFAIQGCGNERGRTLWVMMWHPRRCGGMTTVFWAQRGAATAPGAAGVAEEEAAAAASSHRTAARPARRGRAEALAAVGSGRERKAGGASAGAAAAACMIGPGLGGGGGFGRRRARQRWRETARACGGVPQLFFLFLSRLCVGLNFVTVQQLFLRKSIKN